ncbi:MAG: hypothetical protein ACKV2O_19980 [Acidimicrobiales bacterium]
MVLSFAPFQRRSAAYGSLLVCDGCSHQFEVEAGRPIEQAERDELYRSGLALTLAGLSRERVDDPPPRAAEIARACAAAGFESLQSFDSASFEALVRRLDARLLPDQRQALMRVAYDVSRSGRTAPRPSPVLQTLGSALGLSVEEMTSGLTA